MAALPTMSVAQNPAVPAIAQATARLSALNARLVALIGESVAGSRRPDDTEFQAVAAERLQLLVALIDTAPGEVLRAALSPAQRASLPLAALALGEEHVDLSGAVEVFYEDGRGSSRLRHALVTATGRVSLHFATPPPGWTTGDRVRVRGVRVGTALALNGDGASSVTLAEASAPDLTEQRTLVILVNFQDNPSQPYTAAQAAGVVFGTTSEYLQEVSAGRTWLTGDVVDWSTIAMNGSVCDTSTLATLAKQAAVAAGKDLAQYSRFMYAFPQNACAWWGLGSVGGSPSNAWVNGELAFEVAGHELGHNLGLYHSRNLDCGTAVVGGTCTVDEYGDTMDLMGATRGHFNAFQKERLGWFAPGQVQTVTTSGQYAIEPLSAPQAGVKALKILKSIDASTGRRTYYYVELRQGLGFDAFMSGWTNIMSGVGVHIGTEATPNSSYLLDMTPETSSWYDPSLVAGRTFADGVASVVVSPVSVSSTGATVSVVVSQAACVRLAPTVTLSPGAPAAVAAGTVVTYAVSITNNDSSACGPATFALSPAVPAGWSVASGSSSVALSPSASTSVAMSVTSVSSAAPGTYAAAAHVTGSADASHDVTGSASYTVRAPLALSVVTDRTSYARGESVTVTARTTVGGAAVPGAVVSLQVRKADGKTVTVSVTTNATGYATYRLKLGRKDALGTYLATAITAGAPTATTTFIVR